MDKSIYVFELLILILVNAENFMSLWQVDHGKQNVLRGKHPLNFAKIEKKNCVIFGISNIVDYDGDTNFQF